MSSSSSSSSICVHTPVNPCLNKVFGVPPPSQIWIGTLTQCFVAVSFVVCIGKILNETKKTNTNPTIQMMMDSVDDGMCETNQIFENPSRVKAREREFLAACKRATESMTVSDFERIQLAAMLKASRTAASGSAKRFLEEFQFRFHRYMERDDRPMELNLLFSILATIFHGCAYQTMETDDGGDESLVCRGGVCPNGGRGNCDQTRRIVREYARRRAAAKAAQAAATGVQRQKRSNRVRQRLRY